VVYKFQVLGGAWVASSPRRASGEMAAPVPGGGQRPACHDGVAPPAGAGTSHMRSAGLLFHRRMNVADVPARIRHVAALMVLRLGPQLLPPL
jgi:hypothetical protein